MQDTEVILENRQLRLVGPLGPRKMILMRAQVDEALGRLTETVIEFISPDLDLDLGKVVGQRMALEVDAPEEKIRYFQGWCIGAEYLGLYQGQGLYRADVRPWLWFLTRRHDCRIFQDQTVMEIIKQVIGEAGFSDYSDKTRQTFNARPYCVQYRESDFDFLSRLMEEEGIYYYFEHGEKGEVLVLADDPGAHQPLEGHASLEFSFREPEYRRKRDHIFEWRGQKTVQSGKVTLNDFFFETPSADLSAVKSIRKDQHKHNAYEVYDYPGHHHDSQQGEHHARVRMEAAASRHMRSRGACNVRRMAVGGRFKLTGHPREAENAEYLVVSARHQLQIETEYEDADTIAPILGRVFEFDRNNNPDTYRCTFETQPASEPFRSPLTTPWPEIPGIQTAVVVGPKGEEIWTDKYGRVKVQFHWDRKGKMDELSSCWVRSAIPWTGKNWGMIAVPRIGQEVVIQFEEGDPDRPLVTGMLYNSETMPPYPLPANQTQSGVKTNKSKGGGGFNELMMEDKKDAELVRFQSERDYKQIVKNDAEITIGMEHKNKGDLTQTIHRHKTETLKTGDHTFKVEAGSETFEIAQDRTGKVGSNDKLDVGTNRDVDVGSQLTVQAGSKISLVCGGSKIEMTPGKITLTAPQIEVKGSAVVKVQAGAQLALSSSGQASLKGAAMTEVNSSGMLVVKGSITMIN